MPRDLCTAPRIISFSPLSLATDVTDATLGASGLWLRTRTGAGGTATLTRSFLAAAYGSMDNSSKNNDTWSPTPSFPSFFPFPFLTCCTTLPTSFGGKGLLFEAMMVARDTRGKWPFSRNPNRSWWHRHTSLKLFLAAAHGPMDNRPANFIEMRFPICCLVNADR